MRGREMAQVVHPAKEIDEREIEGELKRVLRRASARDIEQKIQWQAQEAAALDVCRRKVREHGLPMKVVQCLYGYNGRRLTVEFVSDSRVDFRGW